MQGGEAFEIGSFVEDVPIVVPADAKIKERPADKRSHMVDRQHAPQQVLCYICCSEFGTSSLPIHLKTCLKKHAWAIEANIVNAEGVSKKTAQKNKKLCAEPGSGPTLPIPSNHAPQEKFDEYNSEAQRIFYEHAQNCLLCRTRDEEYEKLKKAEEEARRRAAEEDARRRAEEEARKRAEEEARRRAEEEARRRAEEDARKQAEDARKRAEDEARRRAEEEARKKAEDDARKRSEEEEEARRRADELARQRAEEEAKRKAAADAEKQRKDREAKQKAAEEARKRVAQAEWERIQRDLARKRAAEEDALIQAQLEEARRMAAEREEEERRRRQMAMGKRNFLRKGEGHIAANEAGKVTQEKEADERAKRDIAEYSLLHAKKGGLVKPSSSSAHSRPTVGSGNYDSHSTSQDDARGGNGKRSRPVSGARSTPDEIVKNGIQYKEMEAKYDSNWNDAWTEEDELNFLKAREGAGGAV